jgi:hypothetical protein
MKKFLQAKPARDPRRERPIVVTRMHRTIYELSIDGQRWASVEYSRRNSRWCIEDSRGKCLAHIDGIVGDAAKASEAIALAKEMIRDERMPSPEYVAARLRDNRR